MVNETLYIAYKTARKIAVAIIGFTVVIIGIALLVLPGPAFIVIPAGLAILALEFAWARRWLKTIKARAADALSSVKNRNKQRNP